MQILLDPTNEWATSQYKIPPTVKNPKQKKELNNWWAEQLQSGETYRYPYGMWTGWSHRQWVNWVNHPRPPNIFEHVIYI